MIAEGALPLTSRDRAARAGAGGASAAVRVDSVGETVAVVVLAVGAIFCLGDGAGTNVPCSPCHAEVGTIGTHARGVQDSARFTVTRGTPGAIRICGIRMTITVIVHAVAALLGL